MNHIHRLQADLAASQALTTGLLDGLTELRAYLSSDKFAQDRWVGTDDMMLRIRNLIREAYDEEAIALSRANNPA